MPTMIIIIFACRRQNIWRAARAFFWNLCAPSSVESTQNTWELKTLRFSKKNNTAQNKTHPAALICPQWPRAAHRAWWRDQSASDIHEPRFRIRIEKKISKRRSLTFSFKTPDTSSTFFWTSLIFFVGSGPSSGVLPAIYTVQILMQAAWEQTKRVTTSHFWIFALNKQRCTRLKTYSEYTYILKTQMSAVFKWKTRIQIFKSIRNAWLSAQITNKNRISTVFWFRLLCCFSE